MSQAIWSKYTVLARGNGDGPPETFTAVPEVINLTAPTNTTELVDVSNMDSVGPFKEWLPTFLDAGELSAEMNFLASDATQQQLFADQVAQTLINFRITFNDAAAVLVGQMDFAAYVTGFAVTANLPEQRKATLTLRVTGAVTIT